MIKKDFFFINCIKKYIKYLTTRLVVMISLILKCVILIFK